MHNFLKEDLEKLGKAISEGDKEEVERFFSYWDQHLDSLKMKQGVDKTSSAKKKILDRINTLKASKANAGEAAQKVIQKKIDVLQKKFDYSPSAKEKVKDNKGKFAMDVPAKYSKTIYKKLWSMKVLPKVHTLKDTSSIIVSSKINLDKAYIVYSDILKQDKVKVPSLASISRKV